MGSSASGILAYGYNLGGNDGGWEITQADEYGGPAATGRDDPTIAARLGIPVSQVRSLRKEFDIPPGETRWTPRHRPGGEAR